MRETGYTAARPVSSVSNRPTFSDGGHISFDKEPKREGTGSQNNGNKTNGLTEADWHVGDIVIHRVFGRGVVLKLEGDGIIKVNFDSHGIKSIMCNHPAVSKGD